MGTINYGTNNYITMGLNIDRLYDAEPDRDILDFIIEDLYAAAEAVLDNYYFYYYHVVIKPGYYDGFYIDIEENFPVFYDDSREKAEANKELTQLKKCMFELLNAGLVAYYPGWATSYENATGTKKAIKKAVAEMRASIKYTPTWRQYAREGCI